MEKNCPIDYIPLLYFKSLVLLFLCSRLSTDLTMTLYESAFTSVCLVSLPSLLQCLHFFLLQIFFHVVNPRFPLSSHAFDVAVECLLWESIIFHPFHVTEPCKSSFLFFSFLFWILSIIVSFCSYIFLIVSFLTFCSLETPSIFLSQPICVDRILLSSRFCRFQQLRSIITPV